MQCSSPRANLGLSIFPKSMLPSVFPAPTIVCNSSIKSSVLPSSSKAFNTLFRRSSKSPRYLAPAINADKSKEKSFLPLSASGTSPLWIRIANPSTIAVLPTPGSPTSTGLFFVFRERIKMTRRISSSRPITGSSLPSSARATSSLPYNLSGDSSSATAAALIGSESQVSTTSALPSASSKIFTMRRSCAKRIKAISISLGLAGCEFLRPS